MKCQFVGGVHVDKHLPNPEDYECHEEATHTLVGNHKQWHFCQKHFEEASDFKDSAKHETASI